MSVDETLGFKTLYVNNRAVYMYMNTDTHEFSAQFCLNTKHWTLYVDSVALTKRCRGMQEVADTFKKLSETDLFGFFVV